MFNKLLTSPMWQGIAGVIAIIGLVLVLIDFFKKDNIEPAATFKWEVYHVNWAENKTTFKTKIEDFVNSRKPSHDGVYGALSAGKDFYIWARNDNANLF